MTMPFRFLSRFAMPVILGALSLMPLPATSHAADWDIEQLMLGLAKTTTGHARFVEEKSLAIVNVPIMSSGELFYRAPDFLERRTFKPRPESMTVDGDNLLIVRGEQKYHLQLTAYPELAAFIDSIRGTLAGDRKALERNYRLSLQGDAAGWVLELLPVDAKMRTVVRSVHITGVGDEVRSISITQADGDSSLMRIQRLPTP